MNIKKYLTFRVILMILTIILAIIAIAPNPWASGVVIKSIESNGFAANQEMSVGEKLTSINGQSVNTVNDFKNIMEQYPINVTEVTIGTEKEVFAYNITTSIGFSVDNNLTVIDANSEVPIQNGMVIKEINGKEISNYSDFQKITGELIPRYKFIVNTNKRQYAFLAPTLDISVVAQETTNLKKGLDLQGGTRVILKPVGEEVTDAGINDLITVMGNRLNVYGLSDLIIKPASDLEGNKFVVVEIAGATREEVKDLIGQQGKFEAKIGDVTVFEGGKEDVTYVCRSDGTCSGVRSCNQVDANTWSCNFEFTIHLSPGAAKKQAEATKNLEVNLSDNANYLSKKLELFLDKKLVDSLYIGKDLKGQEATAIVISGPGYGTTKNDAVIDALKNMNKLQTILITGSLNYDLEIVKMDSISPTLGQDFVQKSIYAGFAALLGVAIVIFVRYRSFKILIPIMITVVVEVLINLGFAAMIRWNLDIAAIAGIIVSVGTGVNDQIVIVDEILKGNTGNLDINWKQRIKQAFTIIFGAFGTIVAAMVPLWWAGAGLLKGLAVTTIIGACAGVLITRPAFASIIEKLLKKED